MGNVAKGLRQSEAEIRGNRPVAVFVTMGEDGLDKVWSTRVLSIVDADDWYEQTALVDAAHTRVMEALEEVVQSRADGDGEALHAAMTEEREARRAFARVLIESLERYNPAVFSRDALRAAGVTGEQALEAFQTLREITDPFEAAQSRSLQKQAAAMASLTGGMSEETLGKAMDLARARMAMRRGPQGAPPDGAVETAAS